MCEDSKRGGQLNLDVLFDDKILAKTNEISQNNDKSKLDKATFKR
jgi:hypothetical protein